MSEITLQEIEALCQEALPWAVEQGMRVETLEAGRCRVRLPHRSQHLRPGGTISGPALMGLADFAMYIAVLSAIGRVELAVTTNLTCNFLRKAAPADILADCRLIKLGKRLAYGEVFLYADGGGPDDAVAHVTATYSIPPS